MGRLTASLLAVVLGAAAAVALVACGSGGSSDLLPGTTASEINSNLDQVQQLVGEGDCIGAEDAATAVGDQVEELDGVDSRLKEALREGAARLSEVVAVCEEVPDEEEQAAQEELEALEETEAEEEAEKKPKPDKPDKPEKEKPEKEAKEPAAEPTEPPTEEEGEEEEAPPAEPGGGTPSGGVGPSAPAGEG
jgi:outer membrane biosynthesis protein TonB